MAATKSGQVWWERKYGRILPPWAASTFFAPLIFGPPPLLDGDHHLDLDPDDDDNGNDGAGPWQGGKRIWFEGLYHSED